MDKQWILDASMEPLGNNFCFCPIEGDIDGKFTVVTGLNFIGPLPPGELVAILHHDGQAAVDRFTEENAQALETLKERLAARST